MAGNIFSTDGTTDKIYKHSGFSTTISSYFSSPSTPNDRYQDKGKFVAIKLRIKRPLLERIDKNYHGFKSRNGFIEHIIEEYLKE